MSGLTASLAWHNPGMGLCCLLNLLFEEIVFGQYPHSLGVRVYYHDGFVVEVALDLLTVGGLA